MRVIIDVIKGNEWLSVNRMKLISKKKKQLNRLSGCLIKNLNNVYYIYILWTVMNLL